MRLNSIIPIIGHGTTDIVDLPCKTIFTHAFSFLITQKMSYTYRKQILLIASIIHMSNDLIYFKKYKFILSSIMHFFWLKKPIIAKIYMNLIHTPLHYLRCLQINKQNKKIKISISFLFTIFSVFAIQNNYDLYLEKKFGELWWVAPVIGHIIINEHINYIIKNNYNKKKILLSNRIYII